MEEQFSSFVFISAFLFFFKHKFSWQFEAFSLRIRFTTSVLSTASWANLKSSFTIIVSGCEVKIDRFGIVDHNVNSACFAMIAGLMKSCPAIIVFGIQVYVEFTRVLHEHFCYFWMTITAGHMKRAVMPSLSLAFKSMLNSLEFFMSISAISEWPLLQA